MNPKSVVFRACAVKKEAPAPKPEPPPRPPPPPPAPPAVRMPHLRIHTSFFTCLRGRLLTHHYACMHAYVIPTHKSDFWLFMRDGWGRCGAGDRQRKCRDWLISAHTHTHTHTQTHSHSHSLTHSLTHSTHSTHRYQSTACR